MSDRDQPGLRMRLAHEARRIAGQHAHLDALEATTRRALESGAGAEMREVVRGFAGSLDAHFALEEQVQFPALHGLDPSLAAELGELVADHVRFRRDLGELAALLAGPDPTQERPAALAQFGAVAAALQRHEDREEALLARAPQPS